MYKTIHPDHQASAKVPILEVGFPGEKDYVQLVESSVCTKYVATAWPYRGSDLLPAWPGLLGDVHAREALSAARIDLFVDLYMGNVVPGYYRLMKAKKKSELKKHYEKFLHALVKQVFSFPSCHHPCTFHHQILRQTVVVSLIIETT
jgi:hypothetical protein